MASIDKCYVNSYADYKAFCDWASDKKYRTPRGCIISVSDYIIKWENKDFTDRELPIFNSPTHLDNYLYHNCHLPFIKEWLEDRYMSNGYSKGSANEITDELHIPQYDKCEKVKVIHKGRNNKAKHWSWWIQIDRTADGSLWYNTESDFWVLPNEIDDWNTDTAHSKSSIKAIIRKIIKKWKLPKGVTIRVDGRYVDERWILQTR